MAAKREIKTTLVLDGEQQYRKEMNDAASAIKLLNAQQKAAVAEAKASGDAQKEAAEKAKYLEQKIAEQRKAVAAAERALKSLKDSGVAPNSKAVQTWEKKLADAKTSLYTMQGQLKDTKDELENEGKQLDTNSGQLDANKQATDDWKGALDNLNTQVTLENVGKVIDGIYDKTMSVVRGVARAAKALWEWEIDAGHWADDLITEATQTDFDVETLQAWHYAAQFIDTEVDSIIGARDKLLKNMGSTSKDTIEAWQTLGVATHTMSGDMRDNEDVFWDVLEALASIEDQTQQDAIAQTLLGKSFRDLKPLLQAGRAAWDQYVAEGRDVAVVSADSVAALGELDDAQNKLTASLDKSRYEILASLAPLFTDVSEAMATAVQSLNDFLQTEEGQKAMQDLADALGGIIKSLTGEGGENFQTLIEGAKTALEHLSGAFQWIIDNKDTVVTAIIGITTALGGLKLASWGIKVAEVVKGLKSVFGGGAGGAAAEAVGGGGAAAGAAGGAAKTGILKRGLTAAGKWAGSFAASAAPMLGAGLAGIALAAPGAYALDQYYTKARYGQYNDLLSKLPEVIAGAGDTQEAQMIAAMQDALAVWESEEPDIDPVRAVFEQYASDLSERMGFDIAEALGNEQFRAQDWADAGYDLVTMLADAIEAGETTPVESASTMGANVATAVADGITANIFRVQSAMASLTAAATVRGTLPGFAGAAGRTGQTGATLNATIVMDRTRVGRLVTPVVDGAIGSTIRGRLG